MKTGFKGAPSRREFLRGASAFALAATLEPFAPRYAWAAADPHSMGAAHPDVIDGRVKTDLRIASERLPFGGRKGNAIGINGSVPGPLVRLKEGERITLRVTNALDVDSSIHWHGILLPFDMDGVPGLSYPGIPPNTTFTYQYDVVQNGTYWYHSHSGLQEQSGVYGPLIIDPAEPDPVAYDREYVVMLSDWTFEDPHRVLTNLKKMEGYYNYQRQTLVSLISNFAKGNGRSALSSRLAWGRMRMDATDIADVTGATYTYLMNGLAPESNWTGLFKPGERVRLRFINGSAMSFFDVRIPGLSMSVVQADGQNVKLVEVEEVRIGVAETYDVIVRPEADRAYTVFAESMDRSGHARGTLAPRIGMEAPIPERRPRPLRTMADMGMGDMHGGHGGGHAGHGGGRGHGAMTHGAPDPAPAEPMKHAPESMDHAAMGHGGGETDHAAMGHGEEVMDHAAMGHGEGEMDHAAMGHGDAAMDHAAMGHAMGGAEQAVPRTYAPHGPDQHGAGNSMIAMMPADRLSEPGNGLGDDGWRVLVYRDLEALEPFYDQREPTREIELHLTGNMDRYMWSFDGEKYSEVIEPIQFREGERLRLTLVNDTMMEHPIHLHGMWMQLENGAAIQPLKHTLNVKPAERLSALISADARGSWAFHCHLLYHMEMGMFRVVRVS